jgi:hypothetical protein
MRSKRTERMRSKRTERMRSKRTERMRFKRTERMRSKIILISSQKRLRYIPILSHHCTCLRGLRLRTNNNKNWDMMRRDPLSPLLQVSSHCHRALPNQLDQDVRCGWHHTWLNHRCLGSNTFKGHCQPVVISMEQQDGTAPGSYVHLWSS